MFFIEKLLLKKEEFFACQILPSLSYPDNNPDNCTCYCSYCRSIKYVLMGRPPILIPCCKWRKQKQLGNSQTDNPPTNWCCFSKWRSISNNWEIDNYSNSNKTCNCKNCSSKNHNRKTLRVNIIINDLNTIMLYKKQQKSTHFRNVIYIKKFYL